MAETVASSAGGSDFKAAHPLWTFLKAMSGVRDEFERARLTATGLPSLLACHLSGAALLDKAEESWSLVLQMDGEQLASTLTEPVLAELEPLFQEALRRTTALIATTDRDTSDHLIPPSIETFRVRFLTLAPVMTLQQRMGILFIGREGTDAFSREEQLTLSTLAEHLAIGIENLRLTQTLESRSRDLEEIATRYQSLYNNTAVMMHSIDHDGKLTTVNNYWLQVLGYEASEVLGRRSTDFLAEASRRRALEVELPRFFQTGVAKDIEYQMVKKDGDVIDVLLSATAEFDEQGKIDHTLVFIVDVTDRKQAEEALRQSEERYRQLYDKTPVMMHEIEEHRGLIGVNDQWLEVLGYEHSEVIGKSPAAFMTETSARYSSEVVIPKVFKDGSVKDIEYQFVKKNGEVIDVLLSAIAEWDKSRNRKHALAFLLDVTERKRAERQAAERTAELESFSYSVSHDLRAPLRAIDGFSRILLEDYGDQLDAECSRLLNIIRDNTQTMGQLIDDLLAFSRLGRQPMRATHINMTELAKAVFDELTSTLPERRPQLNVRPLPPTSGDPTMIRQVFVNLMSNAIKFTNSKASAVIEIGQMVTDGEDVYYVKDNGVGFDMQYADKLFGVFQRLHTPDEFEGTGVGLAIVQRIIQRHGGRIRAEGKVDEGATFFFTLSGPEGTS